MAAFLDDPDDPWGVELQFRDEASAFHEPPAMDDDEEGM